MTDGLISERGTGYSRQTETNTGVIMWDWLQGVVYGATLSANTNLTLVNVVPGLRGVCRVTQDATGGWGFTLANATIIGPGVRTEANSVTIFDAYCDDLGAIYLQRQSDVPEIIEITADRNIDFSDVGDTLRNSSNNDYTLTITVDSALNNIPVGSCIWVRRDGPGELNLDFSAVTPPLSVINSNIFGLYPREHGKLEKIAINTWAYTPDLDAVIEVIETSASPVSQTISVTNATSVTFPQGWTSPTPVVATSLDTDAVGALFAPAGTGNTIVTDDYGNRMNVVSIRRPSGFTGPSSANHSYRDLGHDVDATAAVDYRLVIGVLNSAAGTTDNSAAVVTLSFFYEDLTGNLQPVTVNGDIEVYKVPVTKQKGYAVQFA